MWQIVLMSVVVLFSGITLYFLFRQYITKRPNLKISFPDGTTRATYHASEQTTLAVHIENVGTWLSRSGTSGIRLWIYLPSDFTIKKMILSSKEWARVFKAPSGGRFRNMSYTSTEAFSLCYGEVEEIRLEVRMPEHRGRYEILMPIFLNEIDLGVKTLEVAII